MNTSSITVRLDMLRKFMHRRKLSAFIIPTTDPHSSEYTPAYWECRKWISGFEGSAGTVAVTMTDAALWTDSRYFLAAEEQLKDTEFHLIKEHVEGSPSIAQWIISRLKSGESIGIDGWVFPMSDAEYLRNELKKHNILLNSKYDPFNIIWKERPFIPINIINLQSLKYAGETATSKIERLRKKLHFLNADGILISALDEVAWLLNLRGTDVECNPVFVAYCLVLTNTVKLYINKVKTTKVFSYLKKHHIQVCPYEEIEEDLKSINNLRLLLPPETNVTLVEATRHNYILSQSSPIAQMKAIKNTAEIDGFHNAMLRDGIALVKFLRWLYPAVKAGGQTEMSVDQKLTSLRAEHPLFRDISFPTIVGYKAHGAIVHYEAKPKTNSELKPEGLLLIDSGAQYQDGTTDITRTIALGKPTEEEKHIYTLVLKGHIALSRTKFPVGTSGTQLDLAARYSMWQEGYNFGHGTGHGVGSYLCVHEGPHQIRMNYVSAPIMAGMTVTDEPGLYLSGKFGIRIENMLLVIPYKETAFGKFLAFEPLTLCPIDTTPIDFSLLSKIEIDWLNNYHKTVKELLFPLLNDKEDKIWLTKATQPISIK